MSAVAQARFPITYPPKYNTRIMKFTHSILFAALASAELYLFKPEAAPVIARLEERQFDVFDSSGNLKGDWLSGWELKDIKAWIEATGGKVTDSLESLSEEIEQNKDKLADEIRQYIKQAEANGNHILNKGKEFYEQAENQVKEGASQANKAKEGVEKEVEQGANKAKEFVDEAVEQGKKAAQQGGEFVDQAVKQGGEFVDQAAQQGEKAADEAAQQGEGFVDQAVEQGKKAAKQGGEFVDQAVQQGKDVVDQAVDQGKEAADQVKQGAEQAINQGKEFVDQAKEGINQGAQQAKEFVDQGVDSVWKLWKDSKLREFLESRKVDVPNSPSRDDLLKLVEQTKAKIDTSSPFSKSWFNGFSVDELKGALKNLGDNIEGTRAELEQRLYDAYRTGTKEGQQASSDVLSTLKEWKDAAFESWSLEDLKGYLADFGDSVAGTKDELLARAKSNYNYFVYGPSTTERLVESVTSPISDLFNKLKSYFSGFLQKTEL